MEENHHHHISDSDNSPEEDFSDRFICCVCLDLLYKPVVLSCGHITCFWCMFRSMSFLRKSHSCALCRDPYYHFPAVCHLMHSVLLKLYPLAYARRYSQTLEQEEKRGLFSPKLDIELPSSQANHDSKFRSEHVSEDLSENMEKAGSVSRPTDGGDYEGNENLSDDVKSSMLNQQQIKSSRQILVADVLCSACKSLLFHPVVLNCGHVYCKSCIIGQDEEKLKCRVCPSFHPTGYPKVCMDLHNFLVEQFPDEIARRRDDLQLNHSNPTAGESKIRSSREEERSSSRSCHIGVGCDYCGMYPIIGDRYRCKDCVERSGFDLCSDCHNTSSKLPGRFNQQHTAEHQFELISSNFFHNRTRIRFQPLVDDVSGFMAHISAMAAISGETDMNGWHATSTNRETDEDTQDDSERNSEQEGI